MHNSKASDEHVWMLSSELAETVDSAGRDGGPVDGVSDAETSLDQQPGTACEIRDSRQGPAEPQTRPERTAAKGPGTEGRGSPAAIRLSNALTHKKGRVESETLHGP
ncbi:hypothetical protein N7539_000931 [Penicillium diatomitis]|uniref:Uncharacterized protein n=1 Tax=Penicillium diatomitis TaxID=2819901 RepID=A0A9W9XNQ6_9EURO|nr:uncharacterized protein N7539_000931 [Penicillium diatomitis]KAJ5495815.1 hypothetical protein N7539_000931 [Penicillium diatomitis]